MGQLPRTAAAGEWGWPKQGRQAVRAAGYGAREVTQAPRVKLRLLGNPAMGH